MLKRFCRIFSAVICLCLAGVAQAQDRVEFVVFGKDKGSVESMQSNGVTYVNIQRAARKFGVDVELFATSKQAKLTARGFYAILTGSLDEVIVNGKNVKLSGVVINNGGNLMAPVDFFLLPSFQKAINRYVEFKDNRFIVERRFNMVYDSKDVNGTENVLRFTAPDNLKYTIKQINGHTVTVLFENVVLKRDVYERFNTDYITSMSLTQLRENAELKIILGHKAKDWNFTPEGKGKFAFRAAVEKRAPVLKEDSSPVIKADPTPQIPVIPSEDLSTPTPSVLAEDDFEEMEDTSSAEPVVTEQPEGNKEEEQPVAQETNTEENSKEEPAPTPVGVPVAGPVIKAEPHPLSISEVHKKIRIVVDPGHGGKDAGAVRGRYREKDWNLAVANELVRLLKKGGFDVKATRSSDVFIALGERAKISNNFKADLFVSIHTNATKNTAANGFQVYFRSEKATDKEAAETAALENEAMQYEEAHYNFVDALLQSMAKNEFMNESSKLSGYIQKEVYRQPGIGVAVNPKTGLRQANFYVLRGVNAPSVLVEMGFISSPKDRVKLSNANVQKKMALGIYNGIVQYAKTELQKNK